jgi:hypothetical protein
LSHCWGLSHRITATSATLDRLKKEISLDELPKTFQDAIIIAERLSVQYLWIDPLCIIQDDPLDWRAESSKMADVYTQSYLTISASTSTDDSTGCFRNGETHTSQLIARPFEGVARNGKEHGSTSHYSNNSRGRSHTVFLPRMDAIIFDFLPRHLPCRVIRSTQRPSFARIIAITGMVLAREDTVASNSALRGRPDILGM